MSSPALCSQSPELISQLKIFPIPHRQRVFDLHPGSCAMSATYSTSSRAVTTVVSVTAAAVAVAGGYALYRAATRRPHPYAAVGKKLPATELLSLPPLVKLMFGLPEWLLVRLLPGPDKEPADAEIVTGKPSHIFTRLSPRVLSVMYEYQTPSPVIKQILAEYADPDLQARLLAAASDQKQMKEDFALASRLNSLPVEAFAPDGAFHKEGLTGLVLRKAYMAAIKLEDGSVLVYNPVKLTPELAARVESELGGHVKWIVSGSAYHTTFLKSAATHFPEAQIVAPTRVAILLAKVGVKVEWDYTQTSVLSILAQRLAPDLELFYVPDPLCHPLLIVHRPSKLILEVDLMYRKEDMCPLPPTPDALLPRLFWEQHFTSSANGVLPTYRFPLFFGVFFPCVPRAAENALDETLLALKKLISNFDYDKVWSAHRGDPSDAAEFREWVQRAWVDWLQDPYTLLQK